MKKLLVIFLSLLATHSFAEEASGKVFVDANQNGQMDPGEMGLSNVRVSNGKEVVRTDGDGRYEIKVDDETILFVTKPKNFAVPLNLHMLPQFYYIHQPKGSPTGLRYQGIDPTGPLPEQINFPLVARPASEQFSFSNKGP